MKKGFLAIDTVGRILIGMIFLLVVLLIIYMIKEKSLDIVGSLKDIFKIGR